MSRRSIQLAACAALGALALSGCTYDQNNPERVAVADTMPAARITGPAENCIPIARFNETRVRSNQVIDFLTTSRKGWRNTLPDSCPGLMTERAFSFGTSLSQLCNVDIIRPLVSTGGTLQPTSGCGLGQFTPIELVR